MLPSPGRSTPLRLKVTGIVSTPDLGLPYWWGDGAEDFPFGQSGGSGQGRRRPTR